MDWNAKSSLLWDWDSPPPPPAADFGLLAAAGSGGASPESELGTAISSKSSVSASIDSSSKLGNELLGHAENPEDQERRHLCQDAVAVELKLGKRTYFEDAAAENGVKNELGTQFDSVNVPAAVVKKARVPHQGAQSLRCQVEGCSDDLRTAKDYHRKHRVCEAHSKCPLVIVGGQERRFCQQCSRFHALSKFDQKKRSCRRRLFDHNARRRKPQPEIISFNSMELPLSLCADKRQINFMSSKVPSGYLGNNASSNWECSYDFKFPNGPWLKTTKAVGSDGTHLPNSLPYSSFSTHSHVADGFLPHNATSAEVLNQGSEPSIVASNLDGAPELRRALSLLSTSSWIPPEHGQTSSLPQLRVPNHTGTTQFMMQFGNSTSVTPLAKQAHVFPFPLHSNGGQLQEFHMHKASFGASFYDSSQIH